MKALLILLLFASSVSFGNQKIEVFTNDKNPVTTGRYQVTYYNLDDRARAHSLFPQNLPADVEQAKTAMAQFMKTPEFQKTSSELKAAYVGYVAAQSYKLAKIPAIVINEKYILYGLRNVQDALVIHNSYQKRGKVN